MVTGRFSPDPEARQYAWQGSASGLAAVWATDNTREALWDAMARKEVYATTGTRLLVRVFAGFDFVADDVQRHDFAEYGYSMGVPMGGDLSAAPEGKAPAFVIRALRDADGANLDRIQVVKGWMDAKGELKEKVYDVVWSGDRKPGPDGKLPPVGNTVDVAQATYTNTIGAPLLASYWRDPEFNPSERAFYYVRVLEIPTPRWTTYDAEVLRNEAASRSADVRSRTGHTPRRSGTRQKPESHARVAQADPGAVTAFLGMGGLLFGLFELRQTKVQEAEIVVTTGDVERIATWFQATWQRPPSNAELRGAVDDYVRQEVLYRAALSLGLESDDTVVHRRMSQKMEFLLEQGIPLPTEADLRA